jgi:hypothetical protein
MESGFVRIRRRRQRRPGLTIEKPLVFYPKHWFKSARAITRCVATYVRLRAILWRIEADPDRFVYRDAAITPTGLGETDALVTSTRITDHSRRRMARAVRAKVGLTLGSFSERRNDFAGVGGPSGEDC